MLFFYFYKTTKTLENFSTPENHFVLPRVSYKLPLQIKTVCLIFLYFFFILKMCSFITILDNRKQIM